MFDDRILQVGIEINGVLQVYEGLYIYASGQKYANELQNECDVKILNLPKEVRDQIITNASPWNDNVKKKRLIIRAGRASYGSAEIFSGDIVTATATQPPDIGLEIKAMTGNADKLEVIAKMAAEKEALKQIAGKVADAMGLSLTFQATDKLISNWSYSGPKGKMVNKLMETGDIDAFVDDGKLIVKDTGAPLTGLLQVISEETQMVGIPEITQFGVKVKTMFNNQTTLGGGIKIESKLNPAASGEYSIFKLGFELANRDTPFYWVIEASNSNIKSILKRREEAKNAETKKNGATS